MKNSVFKLLPIVVIAILLWSCGNSTTTTIVKIGDSKEDVIKKTASMFVKGEKIADNFIRDNLHNDDCITLYNCVYNGIEYYKFRVYLSDVGKVRRVEIKLTNAQYEILQPQLESEYGVLSPITIMYEDCLISRGEEATIIVRDYDDKRQILLVQSKDIPKL